MNETEGIPSPPPSDEESWDGSSSDQSDNSPYTPQEIADLFLDFYQFLATLHFDKADLKVAPPDGWPGISQDACPSWKTDYTIETLRRLPFYNSMAFVHYKCRLIDYSTLGYQELIKTNQYFEDKEIWDDEDRVNPIHLICIARGWESYGRMLFLHPKTGFITEEMIRADIKGVEDIKTYFDNLKEDYRSLRIIPRLGHVTMEVEHVPERAADLPLITEEQVCAQTEDWGTDLDVQYVRQVYRQFGWPNEFRRDDAESAIEKLNAMIQDQRSTSWQDDGNT